MTVTISDHVKPSLLLAVLMFQLLQSVNTQAAKAQQAKMLANKKTSKDFTAANEESGSTARPSSPNAAQLPVSSSNLLSQLTTESCVFTS